MEYVIVAIGTVVMAVATGWLYGRNDVDPFTTNGKNYYNPKGE